MPVLKEIRIYPIKSLGGIALSEAIVEERGFRYDRRWMLVTPEGKFLTQRTIFPMSLIDVALTDSSLRVWHRNEPANALEVPLDLMTTEILSVTVWDDTILANVVSAEADQWFSHVLGFPCRLVRMPETTHRTADQDYAQPGDVVSFADGYPYLMIGASSLEELNRRIPEELSMTRFRPNLIIEGSQPHEEDTWSRFSIGDIAFRGVKPCARCVLTTIDPATGEKGKEPLKTLATYRRANGKIYFGENCIADVTGVLRVGDVINITEYKEPRLAFEPA
ncbi:MOSC domain-containing protein [Tellurirhabdus bombi]|uniref:MOSC domain-containing protein n=1 Tax=Tellurirhabdus bombi TaxID=2907205 RepID=UPI001F1FF50B|nr:MOSC N-terminal beta barrel domain-containing protein [Tellurirhabdus bombi]